MKDCEHEDFSAAVAVNRLGDDGGPIRNYVADITVSCARCGLPFHFVGAPAGLSFYRPMVDVPGTTLHAPIAPGNAPVPDGIRIEFQRGNEA